MLRETARRYQLKVDESTRTSLQEAKLQYVTNPTTPAPEVPRNESFSQFVARVLDQLSLSAWLPSAALVTTAVFLAQVRIQGGSPSGALRALADFDLPDAILVTLTIVVGTVVTQAFEFEAIRCLEGYWGRRRPWIWIARIQTS